MQLGSNAIDIDELAAALAALLDIDMSDVASAAAVTDLAAAVAALPNSTAIRDAVSTVVNGDGLTVLGNIWRSVVTAIEAKSGAADGIPTAAQNAAAVAALLGQPTLVQQTVALFEDTDEDVAAALPGFRYEVMAFRAHNTHATVKGAFAFGGAESGDEFFLVPPGATLSVHAFSDDDPIFVTGGNEPLRVDDGTGATQQLTIRVAYRIVAV